MAPGRFTFPIIASLPSRGESHFLYALEASDGSIKVGRTRAPRTRLTQHLYDLRARGVRMGRFAIAECSGDVYLIEQELIKRVGRIGTARPGTHEWFRGIPWGAAYNLLRQITPRQFIVL